MNQSVSTKKSNSASHVYVKQRDLPLHCPMPAGESWNSHPKVYLPIEDNGGKAKCPYCGTDYTLKDK